jgi:hypothetical protein
MFIQALRGTQSPLHTQAAAFAAGASHGEKPTMLNRKHKTAGRQT